MTPEVTTALLTAQEKHESFLLACLQEESKSQEVATKAITDRWTTDMASDNLLAKVIRPAVLIYLLSFFTLAAIAGIFGFVTPEIFLTILQELLTMVFTAYFIGRTVEKGITSVTSMMAAKKGK